jgi:PAS domain S-box-containing protein
LTNSRDAIAVYVDGAWRLVNPAAVRMFGAASAEELLGVPLVEFAAPVDRERIAGYIRARANGEEVPFAYCARCLRRDGSEFDADATIAVFEFEGKRHVVLTLRDVTEAMRAEEALRAREADYRDLFENMHSAFMLFEVILDGAGKPYDHRLLLANRAFEVQTGLDRFEQIGRTSADLAFRWPEDVGSRYYDIAMYGGTYQLERFNKSLDRYYDVRAFSAGNARFGLLVNDVTDRKRAEEALRASEQQVRRKLAGILSPEEDLGELELRDIIDIESTQKLVDECYAVTGVPASLVDLSGRNLIRTGWQPICQDFHRVHPETARNCLECDLALHEDAAGGIFHTYICKNGLRDCATPLTVGGRVVGYLFTGQFFFEGERPDESFFREQAERYGFPEDAYLRAFRQVPVFDRAWIERVFRFYLELARMISALSHANLTLAKITEQAKLSQMRINELNENLERRVEQRTAELRAAVEEIDSFSYSVSHDLRSPLRAVDGYCRILIDELGDRLDDERRSMLVRMRQAAQRMGQLIEGLLALTRLSRTNFNPRPLDLSEIAETVVERLRSAQPWHPVRCTVKPGLRTHGDDELVEAVLANLLDNAWKYTAKKREPRVEVGSIEESGRLVFYVKDNGAGFDEAYSAKLFQPFERLHSADEYPGSGIGLASAKRIVARHGGLIWAKGKVGIGATFYFTLGA